MNGNNEPAKLTRQEMFNRAWLGLRDQQWRKCTAPDGSCSYSNGRGDHCAWGHVDPENTVGRVGTVADLKTGIAGRLPVADLYFATELQIAHDRSTSADSMRNRMTTLASHYNLTIPSEDA